MFVQLLMLIRGIFEKVTIRFSRCCRCVGDLPGLSRRVEDSRERKRERERERERITGKINRDEHREKEGWIYIFFFAFSRVQTGSAFFVSPQSALGCFFWADLDIWFWLQNFTSGRSSHSTTARGISGCYPPCLRIEEICRTKMVIWRLHQCKEQSFFP
jgi:hypothetical protein